MTDETANLVLIQLREIRAKLAEHDARFDKLEKRFDKADKHAEEMRGYVAHALGLCSVNHLKSENIDDRLDTEIKERIRLAEQLAGLDKRVARIEERADR